MERGSRAFQVMSPVFRHPRCTGTGGPYGAIFVAAKECLFLPVVIGAARYAL